MPPFFQRRGVCVARRVFRWFRIVLWFLLFVALVALSYLHLIGLPEVLKRPLLAKVENHGFELRFSNVRLGFGPSIIIDNAAFRRKSQPLSPRLTAARVEVSMELRPLIHSKLQLGSLQVEEAQLQVPVAETNGDFLSLNHVRLDIAFPTNDFVRLTDCQGSFHGVLIQINGEVSHYSALRAWKFPVKRAGGGKQPVRNRLAKIARTLDQIHFTGTPVLNIQLTADGLDTNSVRAEINFAATGAQTPWGDATRLEFTAACAHLFKTGSAPFLQVRSSATTIQTRWARSRDISMVTTVSEGTGPTLEGAVSVHASQLSGIIGTNEGRSEHLSWDGNVTLASTNFFPMAANGRFEANGLETTLGSAKEVSVALQASRASQPVATDGSWAYWAKLSPYVLDWKAELRDVITPKLQLDHAVSTGHWRAPQIAVENLQAELYGGQLSAEAIVNVASRELHASGNSDLNPHGISQLLTPVAQRWLGQYDWTAPPKVNAQMRLVLPPWANRPPDWRTNLRSSLEIAGNFTVGAAAFRHVWATSAESHFTYTNRVWSVPGLHAVRPDGDVFLDYTGSDATHDFHFVVDSRLDPKDAIPLLPPERRKILDDLNFSTPPHLKGDVWGRWHSPERIALSGTVVATNFSVRGEEIDGLNARLDYTNELLQLYDLRISKDKGHLTTPSIVADFISGKVALTNVNSTVNPSVLPRIIGPRTPKFLTVIHFDLPPAVSASGSFSFHDPLLTDLHFFIRGQQFHWSNLLADRIDGTVNWKGRDVSITNIEANLYNTGTFVGSIVFDYVPKKGSSFHTHFNATDIDLRSVVKGFSGKTNRVEGMLDGELTLNGPSTTNKSTWAGHGHIQVHDALLWDIKLFGLLSPVLNAISPGMGNSRARSASAAFVITNSGVTTDNLEIHSTAFRLVYRGSVDMDRQINARVEADVLRDAPVVGAVLSMMLEPLSKLFEYQVSGTLHNPVMEPLYVPKFLMFLLRPFHTLKSISGSSTSSPPSSTTPIAPKGAK